MWQDVPNKINSYNSPHPSRKTMMNVGRDVYHNHNYDYPYDYDYCYYRFSDPSLSVREVSSYKGARGGVVKKVPRRGTVIAKAFTRLIDDRTAFLLPITTTSPDKDFSSHLAPLFPSHPLGKDIKTGCRCLLSTKERLKRIQLYVHYITKYTCFSPITRNFCNRNKSCDIDSEDLNGSIHKPRSNSEKFGFNVDNTIQFCHTRLNRDNTKYSSPICSNYTSLNRNNNNNNENDPGSNPEPGPSQDSDTKSTGRGSNKLLHKSLSSQNLLNSTQLIERSPTTPLNRRRNSNNYQPHERDYDGVRGNFFESIPKIQNTSNVTTESANPKFTNYFEEQLTSEEDEPDLIYQSALSSLEPLSQYQIDNTKSGKNFNRNDKKSYSFRQKRPLVSTKASPLFTSQEESTSAYQPNSDNSSLKSFKYRGNRGVGKVGSKITKTGYVAKPKLLNIVEAVKLSNAKLKSTSSKGKNAYSRSSLSLYPIPTTTHGLPHKAQPSSQHSGSNIDFLRDVASESIRLLGGGRQFRQLRKFEPPTAPQTKWGNQVGPKKSLAKTGSKDSVSYNLSQNVASNIASSSQQQIKPEKAHLYVSFSPSSTIDKRRNSISVQDLRPQKGTTPGKQNKVDAATCYIAATKVSKAASFGVPKIVMKDRSRKNKGSDRDSKGDWTNIFGFIKKHTIQINRNANVSDSEPTSPYVSGHDAIGAGVSEKNFEDSLLLPLLKPRNFEAEVSQIPLYTRISTFPLSAKDFILDDSKNMPRTSSYVSRGMGLPTRELGQSSTCILPEDDIQYIEDVEGVTSRKGSDECDKIYVGQFIRHNDHEYFSSISESTTATTISNRFGDDLNTITTTTAVTSLTIGFTNSSVQRELESYFAKTIDSKRSLLSLSNNYRYHLTSEQEQPQQSIVLASPLPYQTSRHKSYPTDDDFLNSLESRPLLPPPYSQSVIKTAADPLRNQPGYKDSANYPTRTRYSSLSAYNNDSLIPNQTLFNNDQAAIQRYDLPTSSVSKPYSSFLSLGPALFSKEHVPFMIPKGTFSRAILHPSTTARRASANSRNNSLKDPYDGDNIAMSEIVSKTSLTAATITINLDEDYNDNRGTLISLTERKVSGQSGSRTANYHLDPAASSPSNNTGSHLSIMHRFQRISTRLKLKKRSHSHDYVCLEEGIKHRIKPTSSSYFYPGIHDERCKSGNHIGPKYNTNIFLANRGENHASVVESGISLNKNENIGYRLVKRRELFERRKRLSDWCLMLATFGIILMMLENEIVFHNPSIKIIKMNIMVQLLITFSTIALLGLIICYYQTEIKLFKLENFVEDWRVAITSHNVVFLILELTICIIHPFPKVWMLRHLGAVVKRNPKNALKPSSISNSSYVLTKSPSLLTHSTNSQIHKLPDEHLTMEFSQVEVLLSVLMFARLYLVVRVLLLHSKMFTDTSSRSIGALNRIKFNTQFIFKTLMTMYPVIVMLSLMISWFLLASWILRTCERQHDPNNANIFDAFWLTCITFLAIGYGDLVPNTYCGRGISVCTGIMGAGCTALVVAVLAKKLELTRAEKHVHNFMMDTQYTKRLKNAAANVLRETWLIYKNTKLAQRLKPSRIRKHQRKFLAAIKDLRRVKTDQRKLLDNQTALVDIAKIQTSIHETVIDSSAMQGDMNAKIMDLHANMNEVKASFERLDKRMEKLLMALDGTALSSIDNASTFIDVNNHPTRASTQKSTRSLNYSVSDP